MFGATKHVEGAMSKDFVQAELADLNDEQKTQRDLIVLALAAGSKLPALRQQDQKAASDGSLEKGRREAVGMAIKDQACTDCHKFRDQGDLGSAPDLTGYGSYERPRDFIANPAHDRFYGAKGNDRMPIFRRQPR